MFLPETIFNIIIIIIILYILSKKNSKRIYPLSCILSSGTFKNPPIPPKKNKRTKRKKRKNK